MGAKTGIEWTDATWNPVTGCTQVSPGCDSCYALTLAERFRGTEGHYYEHGFDLQLRPDKLDQPLRWQKPRRIFVNSMSDLFHEQIPDEYIARVFAVMAASRRHTFQVLTKRHGRMRSLLSADHFTTLLAKAHLELPKHQRGGSLIEYPLPNVWLGVSVENQKWANIRIPALLQTPAEIRFLSMEPLLGPVDLTRVEWSEGGGTHLDVVNGLHGIPGAWQAPAKSVDWAIVGGESGRDARPMHPQWVRSLRDQCVAAGVPYLFKQWGEWQDGSAAPGQSGEDHIIVRDGRHERASDHWAEDARGWWTSDLIKARNTREKGSEDATYISRVGKKAAGRELDGETWDQYPAAVDSTPIRETL